MRARLAILAALVMLISGTGVVAAAGTGRPDLPVVFDGTTARVSWADGAPLTPAAGSPLATAGAFLASRGYDARTIGSLRVDQDFVWRGIAHLTVVQVVDGLAVAGAYAKFTFDATGALVHAIDALVRVPSQVAGDPLVGPETALRAAMAAVIPLVADRPALAGRDRGLATFERTAAFYAAPTAGMVLLARQSGRLERAWQVTTWTSDDNLLDVTLVDGAGVVARTERRTANDTYRIYAKSPGGVMSGTAAMSQQLVEGPGAGNAESKAGWLSGTQKTILISGNNAKAYLDRDANNAPDLGGVTLDTSAFTTSANLDAQPDTTTNQAVAVQNLFYLTNYTHDLLYRHGFTETRKNFQVDNFGRGGSGNDPVLAEAQDGSGTDNANFSTPADGSSPRMQMYLWSSPFADAEVAGSGLTTVDAYSAGFGPKLSTTGITAPLQLVDDKSGTTGDACQAMPKGSLSGKIAVIHRGFCPFVDKVKNVQAAGAVGAVIVNNVNGRAFAMGGSGSYRIPAIMVDKTGGQGLLSRTAQTTMRLKSSAPIRLDGDLDSDIVFHEYGHGLTWRMIGSMSGPMAGAIGEGASDALALFINQDDKIGEYAAADPNGIRTAPYRTMTKEYSAMTGAEVHDDGEVYGRVGWLLLQGYLQNSYTTGDLLSTWIAGFTQTAASPTMTSMRDGMLAAAALLPAGTKRDTQTCIVWRAFAQAGVGQGASATVGRTSIVATSSTTVPSAVATNCSVINQNP